MNQKDIVNGSLLIPKELFEKLQYAKKYPDKIDVNETIVEILSSQMFQMLNDYPIPHELCLHLRQSVYPQTSEHGIMYKSYQCLNCKKYL